MSGILRQRSKPADACRTSRCLTAALSIGLAVLLGSLMPSASAATEKERQAIPASPESHREQAIKGTLSLDRSLLRQAEERRSDYINDLRTLVNIDSGTGNEEGLTRVRDFLVGRLRALGAVVELEPATPAVGVNVVGTLRGTGRTRVLLMAHVDTVFPAGEAGRRPFRIQEGRAYGPGVADDKGGVAMILQALALAKAREFDNYEKITVLFNPDEEKSSLGSRDLISRLAAEHDVVLSYEPPRPGTVIVATNGIAYLRLAVTGRAAHAGSEPEAGLNAAVELAGQILRLRGLGDADKGTTVNWTVLRSGERANIIPDQASATADMRMSSMPEVDRVQREARALVRPSIIPGTEVTVDVEPQRPPLPRNAATDRLAALADRIARELGGSLQPIAMGFGTDAGFAFPRQGSTPAVLEGMGVVGGRLHSSEEWADLSSVPDRLYLTVRMLELLTGPAATP